MSLVNLFSKIVLDRFEIYTKNFMNIFHILEQKDKEIALLSYEMEFYRDYWSYMTFDKTYEDDQILCYQYYIDTVNHDDYATVEFRKDIQIKDFKNYNALYKRLISKNQMSVMRNKKTNTYKDFEYERKSTIIIYHILTHQGIDGSYLTDGAIINEKAYDYYDAVTRAIDKYGFIDE